MNLWQHGRTLYAWDRGGFLPASSSLTPQAGGQPLPLVTRAWCAESSLPEEPSYHTGLDVPPSAPDGAYYLNGDPTLPVTVFTRPARTVVTVGNAADMLAALANPAQDVFLLPGKYELAAAVNVAAWQTVQGAGRDLVRVIRHPNGDYADRCFVPQGDGFRLLDLTLEQDDPSGYAVHSSTPAHNAEVVNCRFVSGALGEWDRVGLLVQDCEFVRSGLNLMTDSTMTFRCDFYRGAGGWGSWGARGAAVLSCRHVACGRGTPSGLKRGDITGCLFAHLSYRETDTINGGGELFLVEGSGRPDPAGFHDNLVIGLRASACDGMLVQGWYCDFHDNTFLDLQQRGGGGIWCYSPWPRNTSNNLFRFGELQGGTIDLGPYATGCTVDQYSFVRPTLTRSNQYQYLAPPQFSPRPVVGGGVGNTLSNSWVGGLNGLSATGAGWTQSNLTGY